MAREIARQWFIPGDGIDRHVISADIQRYLGNDATVRPGQGTGENEGISGFWIKAYRNLTTAMISDLRADSARWRQEQRMTGTRAPYEGSRTYEASSAGRQPDRRHGESPIVDSPYGAPSARDPRTSTTRAAAPRMDDRMDIDPPMVAQPDRRHRQPDGAYQPEVRGQYQPDGRGYQPSDARGYPSDRAYPQEQTMPPGYRGVPVTSTYAQDSRYATSGYPQPNGHQGDAPPGYVRQGDYFVPVSSSYQQPAVMPASRSEIPQYAPAYGQHSQAAPPPSRDSRADPRYAAQPDYQDPRYAYPSPAATTVSVSARDREPITSPAQQSAYGAMPQYDQYGRPITSSSAGQPERSIPSARDPRDPTYGRDRERERTTVNPTSDGHQDRRRRVR